MLKQHVLLSSLGLLLVACGPAIPEDAPEAPAQDKAEQVRYPTCRSWPVTCSTGLVIECEGYNGDTCYTGLDFVLCDGLFTYCP
ncbi:hypothetical protein ACLESO_30770 [Pyxidicoccus sp. 3LG]